MGQKAKNGGTLRKAPLGELNSTENDEGRKVNTVVIDPERAPFIPLAFTLYASGEFTMEEIVDELTVGVSRPDPPCHKAEYFSSFCAALRVSTGNVTPGTYPSTKSRRHARIELTCNPQELYREASDEMRQRLNQAIFNRMWVINLDRVDSELSEPAQLLIEAQKAWQRGLFDEAPMQSPRPPTADGDSPSISSRPLSAPTMAMSGVSVLWWT